MKVEAISTADRTALKTIPVKVTIGCSDVHGILRQVIASSGKLRAEHASVPIMINGRC